MRDPALQELLRTFTAETAAALAEERAEGAEIPFEVIEASEGRRGSPPLYCYRALTGTFIEHRMGLLSGLASYAPAARALADRSRASSYLSMRGADQIPDEPRQRADAVLLAFLGRVFSERSDFGFDSDRFQSAYEELEKALLADRALVTLIAPLVGLALEERTWRLELGDGLSLVRGDRLEDAPSEVVWDQDAEPRVVAVLTTHQERSDSLPWITARARFSHLLTTVRLFEGGSYGLGPLAWGRVDYGAWRPSALGAGVRPASDRTLITEGQEDEFRGFYELMRRRLPALANGSFGSPELAWALSRFEMGCERSGPLQALSDHLLALRALLEPEGPGSTRLPQRLSLICARPEDRARLAERVAAAVSLESSIVTGMAAEAHDTVELVDEIGEHLRALLRDAVCGHLQSDLVAVAETVLAEDLAGTAV